jgi:hypothetical protein
MNRQPGSAFTRRLLASPGGSGTASNAPTPVGNLASLLGCVASVIHPPSATCFKTPDERYINSPQGFIDNFKVES